MAHQGRKNADEALLLSLACGSTVEQAAQKACVSARTAHRRLADTEFRRRLQRARGDMVQRSAAMLTAAALEAVKTLLTLQHAEVPPAVRLGAAGAVLEIGVKLREMTDVEERLTALELRIASEPGPRR